MYCHFVAIVYVTARSDEKSPKAIEFGADKAIDSNENLGSVA